jgi:hypothetical protein
MTRITHEMATRTFTIEELDGYLDDPVLDINAGSGRWSEHHEVVFLADDNKLYVAATEVGLTEMQDYYGSEQFPEHYHRKSDDGITEVVVDCDEVEIYEEPVIIRKWRTKK